MVHTERNRKGGKGREREVRGLGGGRTLMYMEQDILARHEGQEIQGKFSSKVSYFSTKVCYYSLQVSCFAVHTWLMGWRLGWRKPRGCCRSAGLRRDGAGWDGAGCERAGCVSDMVNS